MSEQEEGQRAQFTRMVDARPDEWMVIARSTIPYQMKLADRVLTHLQLLGGVWILQTFPAVVFGLFFKWYRAPALLTGWAVGLAGGSWLAFADGVKPVHSFVVDGTTVSLYTGVIALLLNIAVASVVQVVAGKR